MEERQLGFAPLRASVVGIGTWQLGSDWGEVSPRDALGTLEAALRAGVTFVDTADVYGDGRSEHLVGRFLRAHPGAVTVATKMGRRAAQVPESYTRRNLVAWNDRSRTNLGVDTIDLVQLHCPPSAVLRSGATWDVLREMVADQRIRAFGASVETVDQARIAIERGACTVQLILNVFRRRPLREVLPLARARGVGVIVRVPLASGLLSGRYTHATRFAASDHRTYNRDGSAFDVGETFAGIPFDEGVDAAAEFARLARELGPAGASPAQVALRWILDQPGVTTVIPGARNAAQAQANARAAALPHLSRELHEALRGLYERRVARFVEGRW